MSDCDVLIIGAGPTGLAVALWLARQGVAVRIVDQAPEPARETRAIAVHARTLELYEQVGLARAAVAQGYRVPGVNIWARGDRAARIGLDHLGEGRTPYPFVLILPQDRHEGLLVEALAAQGVEVERGCKVATLHDQGDRVAATLLGPDGAERRLEAAWAAGCDGARSIAREAIGAGFRGGTYQQTFFVADVQIAGPAADGEAHIDLDLADFIAVFPLDDAGRVRLIGTVREAQSPDRSLTLEDVRGPAMAGMRIEVAEVRWFSTYRVHHRVAERFASGRIFLLGDSAHVHSPVGGQGMNTGIGDAINLAWKLAAVVHGRAPVAILESYEAERMAFARRLVRTTDRAFSIVTAEGPVGDLLRTRLAPAAIGLAAGSPRARDAAFDMVSQIGIQYRPSPLSRGEAGELRGGDRMPFVDGRSGDAVKMLGWSARVFGRPPAGLVAWCEARKVPLEVRAWDPPADRAGVGRDAIHLVRPDGYIGLATHGDVAEVDRYFRDLGLILG